MDVAAVAGAAVWEELLGILANAGRLTQAHHREQILHDVGHGLGCGR